MVTVTPGSAAPLSSRTRPSMADVLVADCAKSGNGASQAAIRDNVTMRGRAVRERTAVVGAGETPRAAIKTSCSEGRCSNSEHLVEGRLVSTTGARVCQSDQAIPARRAAGLVVGCAQF